MENVGKLLQIFLRFLRLELIMELNMAWYFAVLLKVAKVFQYSLKFVEETILRFKMLDYSGFHISIADWDYSTNIASFFWSKMTQIYVRFLIWIFILLHAFAL